MTTPTYAPNELQGIDEAHRRSILATLLLLAGADGETDPRELALVRKLLDGAVWGVGNEVVANDAAQAQSIAGVVRSGPEAVALAQHAAAALPTAAAREKLMSVLLAIAWADGTLRPQETGVLNAFIRGIDIPGERMSALVNDAATDVDIFSAIVGGRLDTVRRMLDAGAPVMARDDHQWTPLHLAVSKGHLAIVELLLERGADVHARHGQGMPPLFCACNKPYAAIVERLLTAGAKATDVADNGITALLIASRFGQLAVARALRRGGGPLESTDADGQTSLHLAASQGHSALVAFLLAEGAAVDARTPKKCTPLMFAAENGNVASVSALLAARAEVDAVDVSHQSALHYAAANAAPADVIALLLGFGASVNASSTTGVTPLHVASASGATTSAKLLLDAGADLEAANIEGGTAIFLATIRDHRATMELLVARGATVDEAKRGIALAVKSLRSVPLDEPRPPAGLRPIDEDLATFGDYQIAMWMNLEGSPDQVLVAGKDRAGRPEYVGRASDGDSRARYLVVTDKAGKRWLPLFTTDAAAQAFRRAHDIGWPDGGMGLARAVTGAIFPKVFAIGELPLDGVLLDPCGPSGPVALSAEECARVARRAR